jgi:hypothetical protein
MEHFLEVVGNPQNIQGESIFCYGSPDSAGTKDLPCAFATGGRHPLFNAAPVADSQRSQDPPFKPAPVTGSHGGGLIISRLSLSSAKTAPRR